MATVEQPGMAASCYQQAPVLNGGLPGPSPTGWMPLAHEFNLKAEIVKLLRYCRAKEKDPLFKYVSLPTSFIEKHSSGFLFRAKLKGWIQKVKERGRQKRTYGSGYSGGSYFGYVYRMLERIRCRF
jgi:hypothetical protein